MLAVSLACARATALQRHLSLWQSLRETFAFPHEAELPRMTMNVLNGGAHAGWSMDVQEFMIVPQQKKASERVRVGVEVFHTLAKILKERGFVTTVGDEGGFAPALPYAEAAFEILGEAIKRAGYVMGKDVKLALDAASSEWYNAKTKRYGLPAEKKSYTAEELLERYVHWQQKYPLESIEDPFAEDDWSAWRDAMPRLGKKSLLVGDDLFVTNTERLERGIKEHSANAILIKLNQIGTLTETAQTIVRAHEAGFATSISHRSGETSDTTIADLAVACGSEYIKTGSLSRSERVEKYNRLMEIEQEL
jgi:enolase